MQSPAGLNEEHLSRIFGALADPTRRAILARLADGPAPMGELARPFNMTLAAVSRHLKVLQHAGLIDREKQAQRRYAAIRPEPFREVAEWLALYRGFWDAGFDRLDAYLKYSSPNDATGELT